ncbi:GNAT family N-acetyltransferase [Glycomyces buryatensis]|uniref:GNAT family N-acetyltransferase n=1 Tax=Glycomyces buryatensis TaxID=2570927 RepID=A0A4S8QAW2_9ACTN|nr:GNAT family N-acetyltransferase [Glycomyces buryatensis]THV41617.1 GNAT family N-acetyltransferase [Glycomyces buryatensis]
MKIRTAGPADADEIVQVKNASWREAYAGIIPDEDLASLPDVPGERFVRSLSSPKPFTLNLVAERGQDVVGWAATGWYREEVGEDEVGPGSPGEVWAIYVHPDFQGRGIGYALMREAHRHLTETGLAPIRLWMLEGNESGSRFYERYGFVADGERSTFEFSGTAYPTVRYTLPKDRLVDELL